MEYCSQGSLEDLTLNEGRLSERQALRFLADIANGLAHIHEKGIMHRDLKPGNIFISGDCCKIGDFGLVSAKKLETRYCGTPAYMAPEVKLWGSDKYRAKAYS